MKRFIYSILALGTIFLSGCMDKIEEKKESTMVLIVAESPDFEEKIVANSPTPELLESTVQSLAWSDITFVILKKNEQDWLELSGSLDPSDGLSMRYFDSTGEFVSDRAPSSLKEGTTVLKKYLLDNPEWKKTYNWN